MTRTGAGPQQPPRIVRPQSLPRATRPATIAAPEHHHLPAWVKRAHAQASPILADLLGQLSGEPQAAFSAKVTEMVSGISSGKFSLAWNYPALIDAGMVDFDAHRHEAEAEQRQRRAVETARRRASDLLRAAAADLTAEANSRFNKEVRAATAIEELDRVNDALRHAIDSAKSQASKRRDREIDRARQNIIKSSPKVRRVVQPQESWQDVLRRLAVEEPVSS